ncbi:Prostaglandin reductase 1 [Podila verticillata]|nr:Prostaglandin reductase 1 [Podila verticillata]
MSSNAKQLTNTRVLVTKISQDVAPNKSHFRTVVLTEESPVLRDNEVLVQNIIFSLDPYIRHEFAEGQEETTVIGFAIAKVIDSKNAGFPVGALVLSPSNWESYTHVSRPEAIADLVRIDELVSSKLPLSAYNGVLGIPGYTSWDSLHSLGNPKAGETIYISSAAGTLGQLTGQLAKRKGLRVIGSAGSDEKVAFLTKELGFDAAFNYKTEDKRAALARLAGERGLDIYYDLVGDDTIEVVLDLLNPKGRIVSVGILALHQNQPPPAPRNLVNILFKQLRYEGYLVFERYENVGKFWEELTPLVESGEIKYKETVLESGVETLAENYLAFLGGKYTGKVNVQVTSH